MRLECLLRARVGRLSTWILINVGRRDKILMMVLNMKGREEAAESTERSWGPHTHPRETLRATVCVSTGDGQARASAIVVL